MNVFASLHSHPSDRSYKIYTNLRNQVSKTYFSSTDNNARGNSGGGDFAVYANQNVIGGVVTPSGFMQLAVPNQFGRFNANTLYQKGVKSGKYATFTKIIDL